MASGGSGVPSFPATECLRKSFKASPNIKLNCLFLCSIESTVFLANDTARPSSRDHRVTSDILLANGGFWDCNDCMFFLTSPTALRTALFIPSLSPRSKTPLAAPWINASTLPWCCKNLAGEGSGDRVLDDFRSASKPAEGVAGLEPDVSCDGAFPLYLVIILLAPVVLKFSLR